MLVLPTLRLSLFVSGFQMPALPVTHLRRPLTPAMSMRNNPESVQDRAQTKKALRCRFEHLMEGTDFAVGGEVIMPDPCLAVQSFGKFDIRTSREGYLRDVKALSTFASLAGYGLGSETLIDLEVRNTLQIDASKISISNPTWSRALQKLVGHIGQDMNFGFQIVEPKLYKLLIYGPGGHFKPHVDNEKHDGMFGTLMIELPSDYKGGELVVSHRGITKTFKSFSFYDMPTYRGLPKSVEREFTMNFLAHYADCKHEVRNVSSGYRLALIYSLCWNPKLQQAPTPKTTEEISNDIMRHLSSFDGCLGYIFEHHYSIDSLRMHGAKALKGNDRKVYDFLTNASSILETQASTTSDKLIMYIVKASRQDHTTDYYEKIGEPGVESYNDDIFAIDGSEPSKRDVEVLIKAFRTSEYEDIINHREPVKKGEDTMINDRFWRDEDGDEPAYMGNEGGDTDRFYTTFILTFWREKWSQTIS